MKIEREWWDIPLMISQFVFGCIGFTLALNSEAIALGIFGIGFFIFNLIIYGFTMEEKE